MRYGVGDFCHVQSAGGRGSVLRGLSEYLTGLRGAEGLEGQAALGHAVARELPRDRGHELLGPACVEMKFQTAIDATSSL